MTAATAVPCPSRSTVSSPRAPVGVEADPAATDRRADATACTPLSIIATRTPRPVRAGVVGDATAEAEASQRTRHAPARGGPAEQPGERAARRASAAGVPVSTSRAPSSTTTRSAAMATAARCEMTIVVRPRITAW